MAGTPLQVTSVGLTQTQPKTVGHPEMVRLVASTGVQQNIDSTVASKKTKTVSSRFAISFAYTMFVWICWQVLHEKSGGCG